MGVKTYAPNEIQINYAGYNLRGYADGSFIRIERRENTFSLAIGADGEAARSQSANASGSVSITLMQTSVSNDVLSKLQQLDEVTGKAMAPLQVTDAKGRTVCFSQEAWVTKPANVEYGKETGNREWTLECGNLQMFVGGN
jgi:hypothetical protein